MSDQLIPKAPRRMKQPAKSVLRDHLAVAASELERTHGVIEQQAAVIAQLRRPWWKRLLRKSA